MLRLIQELFDRGLQSEIPGYSKDEPLTDDKVLQKVFSRGLEL